MTSETRQVLDIIEDHLLSANIIEREELWNILTALRGPDEEEMQPQKEYTTAVIRSAAFPRLARSKGLVATRFAAPGSTLGPLRTRPCDCGCGSSNLGHFDDHIRRAAYALGLDVEVKG
jgi:hypothetical protein